MIINENQLSSTHNFSNTTRCKNNEQIAAPPQNGYCSCKLISHYKAICLSQAKCSLHIVKNKSKLQVECWQKK